MKAALWSERLSLRSKLPWQFALIATLTVVVFAVFAWLSARALALDSATIRLRSALSQVRSVIDLGVMNQLAALRSAAHDQAIIESLRREGPVSDSAVNVLRSLKGVSDSSVTVELVDRQGRLRLVLPETAGTIGERLDIVAPEYAAVGPLYTRDSVLAFASTVSVTVGKETIGRVRVVRTHRNVVNRRMVANLLEGAVLLTGNTDGTLWSPAGVIQYDVGSAGPKRYLRNGERWVSISSAIPNTPWLYAVELPERLAFAPADALILPFIIGGILVALTAALVGYQVSRRLTTPIGEFVTAAEALARGDRNVRLVATERPDELGRLARAFETMAESVTSRHDTLEAEIDARTGELSTASARLRALHDELRESEKLAMLGRLSGSVGHELRNPLGVMSNVVFLIDTLPEASDKLREYARLLREQIRVSDRIISDLLDRARTGMPVRSRVNVPRLLDEILLRAEVPGNVRVERRYDSAMPVLVLDRDHLAQILWNLVRNALQAMNDRDGTLVVSASHAGNTLRVEVLDSGDGIAEGDAERIFEPMYTTKTQGIGLGLSISRAFARASGGDLYLRPSNGGALFVLEMAAAIAPPAASDGDAEADGVRNDSPPLPLKLG